MAKLPSISGKQVIATFEKFGFQQVRVQSSHHVLKKTGHRCVISVPVHGDDPVARGTLRALIRGAGITLDQFFEALRE